VVITPEAELTRCPEVVNGLSVIVPALTVKPEVTVREPGVIIVLDSESTGVDPPVEFIWFTVPLTEVTVPVVDVDQIGLVPGPCEVRTCPEVPKGNEVSWPRAFPTGTVYCVIGSEEITPAELLINTPDVLKVGSVKAPEVIVSPAFAVNNPVLVMVPGAIKTEGIESVML